jgi:protein disulfide-isomerase-like protein
MSPERNQGQRFGRFAAFSPTLITYQLVAETELQDPRFKCTKSPCAFIHRKDFENEDAVLEYKGDFTSESLIAFINSNKLRSYGRLTQEDRSMIQAFFETKKAYKALICIEDGNSEQLAVAAATPAALKAAGHTDVFVGIVGSEFTQALNHFGIEENSLPAVIVHGNVDSEDKRKFKSELSVFSASEIAKFVKDAAAGKVARWVKSEAEPSDNSDPVKILTGNTVQDIVGDTTKDVLVEVYAPWCGHCKSLAPVYESVALAFADEPRVVIAKIDGTKNDFDLHPVQGFPTLVFFPAHSKAAVPVQGRDARSLIQAVVSNSAFKNLKVNGDALPKSGVVPQFLADMFPMLEEGVLALQSNVLVGPFTAFHFIAAAIVIFTGFTIMLIRSGPPTPAAPAAAAAAAAAPAAAAAAAAAPAAAAAAAAAADAPPPAPVAESVPQQADAASDAASAVADPTESSGLKQTTAGSKSAAAAAASGGAAASAPKPKSSNSKKSAQQQS